MVTGEKQAEIQDDHPRSTRGAGDRLVHLLLLVKGDFAWAAVDEQEQTADDRQDLEEVVLGKVLVRVVLVKL